MTKLEEKVKQTIEERIFYPLSVEHICIKLDDDNDLLELTIHDKNLKTANNTSIVVCDYKEGSILDTINALSGRVLNSDGLIYTSVYTALSIVLTVEVCKIL